MMSSSTTCLCTLNCTYAQVIGRSSICNVQWFPYVGHLCKLGVFERETKTDCAVLIKCRKPG